MVDAYDPALLKKLLAAAHTANVRCHDGVYIFFSGPSFETPAEIRAARVLGADAVGMSTVPEVIVAVHAGLKSLGFSIITDTCLPDALEPVKLEDVIAVANVAEKKLRVLVRRVVERLAV